MVAAFLSTTLSAALSLVLAGSLGPRLGRWSLKNRWARFVVGLLTELRMLPVLVALVPVAEARLGLPGFAVIGLLGAASRAAAIARFVARVETGFSEGRGSRRHFGRGAAWGRNRLRGAGRAALFLVVPEVALLEGLGAFFSQGSGHGLGAALASGQVLALIPLVALAGAVMLLLERPSRGVAAPGAR